MRGSELQLVNRAQSTFPFFVFWCVVGGEEGGGRREEERGRRVLKCGGKHIFGGPTAPCNHLSTTFQQDPAVDMFLNFKNVYKSEFHVCLDTFLNSMCVFKRKGKLILTSRKVKGKRKLKWENLKRKLKN
jgi:hypothetical protein